MTGRLSVPNFSFFNVSMSLEFTARKKDRLSHVSTFFLCHLLRKQHERRSGVLTGRVRIICKPSMVRIDDRISLIHINSREGKCYLLNVEL